MDTSFWIQCNPKIAVEHTTKKYFSKYLYKIVLYCPAGRLVDGKGVMEDAIEHRKAMAKSVNHGGWWGYRNNRDLDQVDVEFLKIMRDLRHDNTLNIKMRVEEPMIQIYGTEDTLKDLVSIHFIPQQKKYVKTVSGPEDDEAVEILNSGGIIRKSDNGYKYKILMRDGRYTSNIKESVLNYLLNLGEDQIKIPHSCHDMLTKSSGYIWNLYLYANDDSIITFLNLISPGIVSNCHELHVLSNK